MKGTDDCSSRPVQADRVPDRTDRVAREPERQHGRRSTEIESSLAHPSGFRDEVVESIRDRRTVEQPRDRRAIRAAGTERGDQRVRAIELRGQWALAAVKQNADARITAAGIQAGSAEYRSLMASAVSMLNTLVKRGESHESASDKADEWLDDQLESRTSGGTVTPAPGGTTTPPPPKNAMEALILQNRPKTQ